MSVSIGRGRRGNLDAGAHKPTVARWFLWSVSLLTVLAAVPGIARLAGNEAELIELCLWAAIVATVDLVPVRVWGSVSVSMSFPVTLAAGMIFLPTEAALVAFVGSFDPRELKHGVSLAKSVFNRSQVAASVMAGSALFHMLDGAILDWPRVLLP